MLLLLLLLGFALSDTVKTKYGSLKGGESLDVRWFKGVPYASPPLNSLRFAPPQAPSAWNGTRDATQFASDCLQWDNNTGEHKDFFFFFSFSFFFLSLQEWP
jgi:para-nitrobenzyl esterase